MGADPRSWGRSPLGGPTPRAFPAEPTPLGRALAEAGTPTAAADQARIVAAIPGGPRELTLRQKLAHYRLSDEEIWDLFPAEAPDYFATRDGLDREAVLDRRLAVLEARLRGEG